MLFMKILPGAHPWLSIVLWITSAVAGFISIAVAVSVLLDPQFAESGVSIFHVGTSLSFEPTVADEGSSISQVSSLTSFTMSESWSYCLSQRLRPVTFRR